jgi:hypothetical protein
MIGSGRGYWVVQLGFGVMFVFWVSGAFWWRGWVKHLGEQNLGCFTISIFCVHVKFLCLGGTEKGEFKLQKISSWLPEKVQSDFA